MTRLFVVLTMVLSLISVYAQPNDVSGWNKSTWRMMPEEVSRLFPGAIEERLKKTDTTALSIKEYPILAKNFNVRFLFDSLKTLYVVQLLARGSGLSLLFDKLKLELIGKYGEPTTSKVLLGDVFFDWIFPSTKISMSYSRQLNAIIINYERRNKETDDKL